MAKSKRSPEEMSRRANAEQMLINKSITKGAWMLSTIMRILTTIPAGLAYAGAVNVLPEGVCIQLPELLDHPTSHGLWPTLVSLAIIFFIYATVSTVQGKFIHWAFRPSYKLRLFFDLAPPPPDSPPPTPLTGVARFP
ncbi:unnamed protein product [Zymoseptoria tritici ST99CH_1A5]|uniref:Uncharacterized protein n=1 Tax=Zymoseptoria tritici ST99CH_1A5 TaxID=1276529 RepID=A0A1Y6LX35_ZYMTR|nr:unnamed protein product [Zymoseptoria tritici ST99CH_1A5]